MQVTLDPAAILIGVFTLLLGVVQLFGMSWIRSVQEKLKANETRDSEFQKAIAAVREMMARDYVPRSEHREVRDEFRDGLRGIDQKLTDINNKLDKKQDKQ
ncbi:MULTISPECIES: hypothetical protein [Burkholderia]|uniref:Uncharacterized protein n=1 Tax=Burkholderia aenigmatica TaxID=2015348 RepID=A0A6P2MPV1_9BURK|nr:MULTISPECIES: hypothetical protein [Burkholderia]MDN8050334.1 hypothetical protein [Burkholderia multivorans]MDS0859929.1 hypothetical protein [Burkholderia pseudomultivorans]QTD89451.1 hypothetical protein J4G50_16885 [Burkholderia anthina]VWB82396.1 hypothetical protein BLA13014_03795 [Burkholderia aenigmatica]